MGCSVRVGVLGGVEMNVAERLRNLSRAMKLWRYLTVMTRGGNCVHVNVSYDGGEVRIRDPFNDVEYTGDSLEIAVDNLPDYREKS